MKRDEVSVGDLVRIKGYGGFAEVLAIHEMPQLSPAGTPMYRVTIKWGPHNDIAGSAKRGIGIEEYPLGRCEPAHEATSAKEQDDEEAVLASIPGKSKAELLAMLAELEMEIA